MVGTGCKARRGVRLQADRLVLVGTLVIACACPVMLAQAPSDQARPAAGGRLAGQVIAAGGAGQPVRRAIVQVAGSGLARSRSMIADDEGRFAFDDLPPGRFTLTASRPAFLTTSYGSTAPGRPGTPITLAAGQQLSGVQITLARGAAIEGRVTNADGEPMPGAEIAVVRAAQARAGAGPADPTRAVVTMTRTDDRGVFRVFELEGGEYFVAAGLRGMDAEVGRLTADDIDVGIRDLQQRRANPTAPVAAAPPSAPSYGFAPVYFPGTHDRTAATPVTVATGEERTGVDMIIRLSPAVVIDGIVTAPDGSAPELLLSLEPEVAGPLPGYLSARPSLSVPAGPDGRFRYIGVSPGTYVVSARTIPPGRGAGPPADDMTATPAAPLWAATTITVGGADVSGVALSLRPAMRVSGRVAFEATTAEPADVGAVRINLRALGVEGGYSVNSGALRGRIPVEAASPDADGTFHLSGVLPGTYQIAANLPGATGWWPRSAMLAGRDLLDVPLEVPPDSGNLGGVVLTFTDRHTELSGTIQTTAGTPATEYFIVVFTADRSLWRPGQRRLRTTRPATDGVFSIRDLPPGDYFVAALRDLDSAWQTAAFLEPLMAASVKIAIGEGASVRQDLRLAQ